MENAHMFDITPVSGQNNSKINLTKTGMFGAPMARMQTITVSSGTINKTINITVSAALLPKINIIFTNIPSSFRGKPLKAMFTKEKVFSKNESVNMLLIEYNGYHRDTMMPDEFVLLNMDSINKYIVTDPAVVERLETRMFSKGFDGYHEHDGSSMLVDRFMHFAIINEQGYVISEGRINADSFIPKFENHEFLFSTFDKDHTVTVDLSKY